MSDVPEQTCSARATCDTMLFPEKHYLYASDTVTDGHPNKLCEQTTKTIFDACRTQEPEARVAYEECTRTGMGMRLDGMTRKVCVNE